MYSFRSMGTDVTVTAAGDEAAIAAQVAATFEIAERRFSRFDRDSELSKLNRASGPITVSEELFNALWRARGYVEWTNGTFEPGVGGAIVALGYDRSFTPGALDRDHPDPAPQAGTLREVMLDRSSRTVYRPEHVQLDLGGMIKGATVDAAAVHLGGCGAIDAGGDAVLVGAGPTGREWEVEVEDPFDATHTLATLLVSGAAVATSAANRRQWRVGSSLAHHLIDPRTRRSATTDVVQATVIAPRAELADVLAKTAFLLGAQQARRLLEDHPHVGAVLVRRRGRPLFVGAVNVLEVSHD